MKKINTLAMAMIINNRLWSLALLCTSWLLVGLVIGLVFLVMSDIPMGWNMWFRFGLAVAGYVVALVFTYRRLARKRELVMAIRRVRSYRRGR